MQMRQSSMTPCVCNSDPPSEYSVPDLALELVDCFNSKPIHDKIINHLRTDDILCVQVW